jgi:hypothetical protein
MKKGTEVVIKLKIKAKDESKLPDWGLGVGILAEQKVTLEEKPSQKNKVRLALMLEEVYKDLLEDTIEKVIEIKE